MRKIVFLLMFVFLLPTTVQAEKQSDVILEIIERWEQRADPDYGFFPWGTHGSAKGYHSNFERGTRTHPTRGAMSYAQSLIASPNREHWEKGNAVLSKLLALQDTDPNSRTFGIWAWYAEEPLNEMASPDFNWADFIGAALAILLRDYPDRLTEDVRKKAKQALLNACQAIIKRNVGPGYTNIAIMGATVTVAAGEILDRPDFVEYGRNRIQRNLEHFREVGGFNEYNSPTYTMVVIRELERMLYLVADPECRAAAQELFDAAMKGVAEHYHVPTAQWAGPHSRTYNDLMSETARNGFLYRVGLTTKYPTDQESYFVPLVPASETLRSYFSEVPKQPIERRDVFSKGRPGFEEIGTTWMDAVATLGSVSFHSLWEQSRGLIGYWTLPDTEVPAVLRLRFFHDEQQDFASATARHLQRGPRVLTTFGLLKNWGSMHPSFDRPRDGVFTAKSFRIVYQLTAKGATVKQLDKNRFELSAGPVRAVVHVMENSTFDGQPVVWKTEQADGKASVIGICYEGEAKEFAMPKIEDIRIVTALELLQGNTPMSDAPIQIGESDFETKDDGKFYSATWSELGTIHAPILPTNR